MLQAKSKRTLQGHWNVMTLYTSDPHLVVKAILLFFFGNGNTYLFVPQKSIYKE